MVTLEEARKVLGEKGAKLSDLQVENLITLLQEMAGGLLAKIDSPLTAKNGGKLL